MATGPGGGFSIFNLLDQYEGSGPKGVASGPGPTARSSTTNGRNSDNRRNGDGSPRKERPAPIGVPSRNIRDADSTSNTVSPLNTFTPPISKALDATEASEKKRKLEENGTVPPTKKSRFEGMTKEQKIAEVKRLKALKAARDAARANGSGSGGGSGRDGNGSGSAASNPNSPITAEAPKRPAKGSYAEIMERAKQIQATSSVPAKIVHKETKVEKKKIGKSDKPEATKKLPAISTKTQGSKPTATSSGVSKPSPIKKPVGRPVGRPTGSRPDDRKSAPAKPAPSKPRVQVEWNGTARPSATAKPSSSKPESKAYERDRDRDRDRDRSWDRDRERERYRPASKRYVYAESDEDDGYSSDDMEATGVDILEEEDRSRAAAIREDIEAEKLERQLAAEKAARRKMLTRR
ncbi:hypothetical protein TWF569_008542 [Orbilia oligospora]|uniref:SPT2 chromatin protein n=1 Tax=Orbilia oligospora TaxID=2813651 RepID=A0A7C8N195_ORBOL|nr:hypothetical protein TWF706_004368 [Orbilia oligospora]KAF3086407.1 hypothetical protein TWF103_001805 [Orbilia oligospora]KAF3090798.1 hypothetical protein TWF102_009004 [Orbilia oligospora]KAF3122497.1 hypothetical protein TWF703_001397 [Orbilia oligospora]KAF3139285.1 hypothetical protein TWF569_008542 [Orbilia oligospora]